MRILFVADGRSATTQGWVRGVADRGHEVYLATSYPCPIWSPLKGIYPLPLAFSQWMGESSSPQITGAGRASPIRSFVRRFRGLFQAGRYVFGPLTLPAAFQRLQAIVAEAQPDLVHALRIPFEGMVASAGPLPAPLIVTIWGNDLTLHAHRSQGMRTWTQQAMQQADGLLADTERDLRLGRLWGFAADRPALVAPGGGGIDLRAVEAAIPGIPDGRGVFPIGARLVVNARGIRAYVRNDTFFRSVPLVLEKEPRALFVCPGMQDQPEAQWWVQKLRISLAVRLLAKLPQPDLWCLFRQSEVFASPATHDGTPNSLLEAMACGCFPVAGDLEALREWITPGVNGLLVDPEDPAALAHAILQALGDSSLRRRSAVINARLVASRAEAGSVMQRVDAFYRAWE